jgi:dolichol-phosphate mannosyltransferase
MPLEDLSVVAPAYNEAEGIAPVVERWLEYLAGRFPRGKYEVVVCNDGSKDATGEILGAIAERDPALRVVTHVKNQGAAAAVTTAIRNSTKAWVLLIDSDGQFPIENVERFESDWQEGTKAYLGIRVGKKDTPFARIGSWGSGQICNLVHHAHVADFNSAFKLVDGPTLRSIHLEAKGLNYSTEVTSRLLERGIVPREVAIEHRPREKGQSSMRAVRGAIDRALFVSYIGFRQLLLRRQVIRVAERVDDGRP